MSEWQLADYMQIGLVILAILMIVYFTFRSTYIDMEDFDAWIFFFSTIMVLYAMIEIWQVLNTPEESVEIPKGDIVCESRVFKKGSVLLKNGHTVITKDGEEIDIGNLRCKIKE